MGSSPFGPDACRPFLTGPSCPVICCPSHGSPVPLLKFWMVSRLIRLTSSGSKKKEPKWVCLSEATVHTCTKHEPRFPSLLHTSCMRDWRSTQYVEMSFEGVMSSKEAGNNPALCPVKGQ